MSFPDDRAGARGTCRREVSGPRGSPRAAACTREGFGMPFSPRGPASSVARESLSPPGKAELLRERLERRERALQAVAHLHLRLEADEGARRGNVGERIAHVARSLGLVLRLHRMTGFLGDVRDELVQRGPLTARD